MHYKNGEKYTGNWFADKRNGQGVHIFVNGDRFEITYVLIIGTAYCTNNTH